MENKIYKLTDNEFIDLVKSSLNISEVLFKLGYTTAGNSWGYGQVKQRMKDLNLSGADFRGKTAIVNRTKSLEVNPEKLFSENSKHTRRVLRTHIIRHNLLPYVCACCGIKEWNGKTLSLELDHINGINNDNRLENLEHVTKEVHALFHKEMNKNKKRISLSSKEILQMKQEKACGDSIYVIAERHGYTVMQVKNAVQKTDKQMTRLILKEAAC